MSLRTRLALVIALLAFLPNLVLALTLGILGAGWWLPLFLWLLLLALVSGLVGYFLAQGLLRPLEELTRALAYLSLKEGPVSELRLPRPQEPPPQEIALLRDRFEELLQRLRGLMEAREAFYGALAHDLKTPLLSAIRTLAYLERADGLGKERRVELLQGLKGELAGALELLENLLALSRLEARSPARETLNLRALAEDLLLRYQEEAKRRGLALEVEGAGLARGERLLVERALANLLDNALRHARSRVRIRVAEGALAVEDDGPGLPLPLEALALPFRQGSGNRGQAGLGLYTAKRVAEAHGGRLGVEESPLGGACLRLELSPATSF
ncbi:MAG: HAMP domain-containing histidine kinase [Thermus sp.]|uniref:sensor histidine kinase n=1 Tax=unclassified Thermus TaxID=2619321 RepID=UPI0002389223|nr:MULTISPECIES: HAMP domain-containing sensor histidine kinase [unclassified Thermus]AEV16509.1 Sensor histidine kinase [Thermus sp. CCB_US3_UF1]MCS7217611.1 HAMP domain-containing histidine kinase [Thermus sp.]MDW8017637.1 HAMP domain-containing sensor histidine kinase [Thermus sp.]